MKTGKIILVGFLAVMLMVLAGCGVGKTVVTKVPVKPVHASSIAISEDQSTVKVPDNVRKAFGDKLSALMYEKGAFSKGEEVKISYRFIQYNPGDQFARWFWGGLGNAGEGTMTVEAKFIDASGSEITTIQSEGKIGSGVLGGSFDEAVGKTAEEISNYAKQNLK